MTSWTEPSSLIGDPFPDLAELPFVDLGPDVGDPIARARALAAEEGRRAGFEQGRFEGFARGEVDGRAAGAQQVSTALAALDAAAAQLSSADCERLDAVASDLVDLALALAEAIVGHEVTAAASPGRDALARALRLAPDRGELVARLHPDDVATIGPLDGLVAGRAVGVVADPAVERGGCILDAGPCRIDAQISPALARIRAVLHEGSP